MPHITAVRLVKLSCLLCAILGMSMVASLFTPLAGLMNLFVDLAHFPVDGAQSVLSETDRLLTAITGGLLVGLGAFGWQIAEHVYKNNPTLGGRALTIGVLAWYVPDSVGSVIAGAGFNVVLNTGFLAMFLVPVFLARKNAATKMAER